MKNQTKNSKEQTTQANEIFVKAVPFDIPSVNTPEILHYSSSNPKTVSYYLEVHIHMFIYSEVSPMLTPRSVWIASHSLNAADEQTKK